MVKPWDVILGLLGRDSKDKHVLGFILDIDMKPRDKKDPQSWHRVQEAAYIPSNELNLLRRDVAEEMGLDTTIEAAVVVCWKLVHNPKYEFSNSFWIKSDLPCSVIFGKQPTLNSIQGYPQPFASAIKHEFDESYDFPKRRTNSWERLKKRTLSWGSSERKDNSRSLSFLQRKPPVQPTNTFATIEHIPPKTADANARAQFIERGMEAQEATNDVNIRNDHAAVKNTAKLDVEPSTAEEEQSVGKLSSDSRRIQILGGNSATEKSAIYDEKGSHETHAIWERAGDLLVSGKSQTRPSKLGSKEEFSSTGSSEAPGLKTTRPQNPSKKQQDALMAVDSAEAKILKRSATNSAKSEHYNTIPTNLLESTVSEESSEIEISRPQSQDIISGHGLGLNIPMIVGAQQSWVGIEPRLSSDQSNPLKEVLPYSGESEADERHLQKWNESELENRTDTVSEPSTRYPESSLNTALNPLTAPESPTSHGNIMSYGMRRFLESRLDRAPGKNIPPRAPDVSDHPSSQQDTRSKIQARKRGKAPKIRSANLDKTKAQDVDLTPAPGANEEWTYDPRSKGYYHVDSDTGSTFWYEESESEESED